MSKAQLGIEINAKARVDRAFDSTIKQFSRLKQEQEKMKKQLRDTTASVRTFGLQNKKTFQDMRNYGAAAFATMSAGLGLMIKTSISFESAFAGVKKTVEATDQEFLQLDKSFKKMTAKMPIAYEELSKIAELGGQLGVGVKDIEKFTETVAVISETTNLTAESAATDFARISNVMSIPIKDMDKMAASLVDLGNNFATTEREVVSFASRIAGSGKIVGMAPSDVMAIATAFSSVGIEAEAGGTAVQKSLLIMDEEVSNFSKTGLAAGQNIELFAKTAGSSAKEFARMWEKHPVEAFNKFTQGLNRAGKNAPAIIDELLGEDVRLKRAFLSLSNAGDLLERAIGKSGDAWKENTAHIIEAEKRFETTESQIEMFKNALKTAADTLGDEFKPILLTVLKTVKPLVDQVTGWVRRNPELTKTITLVTLSLTGLVTVLGLVGLAIAPVATAVGALISPVGLVVAGITALIATFTYLYNTNEGVRNSLNELWGVVSELGILLRDEFILLWKELQPLFEGLKPVLQILAGAFALLLRGIAQLSIFIIKTFIVGIKFLSGAFTALKETTAAVWDAIYSKIKSVAESITGIIDNIISRIVKAMEKINELRRSAGERVERFTSNVSEGYRAVKSGLNFANGGIVNAPIGQPVLATIHGGEMIIPSRNVGQGVGSSINININGGMYLDEGGADMVAGHILETIKSNIRL